MDVGGSYGVQKDWNIVKCIPNIIQSEKSL